MPPEIIIQYPGRLWRRAQWWKRKKTTSLHIKRSFQEEIAGKPLLHVKTVKMVLKLTLLYLHLTHLKLLYYTWKRHWFLFFLFFMNFICSWRKPRHVAVEIFFNSQFKLWIHTYNCYTCHYKFKHRYADQKTLVRGQFVHLMLVYKLWEWSGNWKLHSGAGISENMEKFEMSGSVLLLSSMEQLLQIIESNLGGLH